MFGGGGGLGNLGILSADFIWLLFDCLSKSPNTCQRLEALHHGGTEGVGRDGMKALGCGKEREAFRSSPMEASRFLAAI